MLTGIPKTFGDGEVIFEQGAAAADMYLIRSGTVRIVRREEDGQINELATLQEGGFFGEMALFDPGPRTASAIAQGEVLVEVVDRPTFIDALDRDPSVKDMVAEMSRRIKNLEDDPESA